MSVTILSVPVAKKMQYPKYLENEKLPLMQTAIGKTVSETCLVYAEHAKLISEYACPPDQVEPQAMQQFFEDEVPSSIIMSLKAEHGAVSDCFDAVPYKREDIYRNSTPLSNTTERRLVAWVNAYFTHRNYEYKLELNREDRARMDPNNQEYYDFLGRLPGITIINRCIAIKDNRVSYEITFRKCDWYKKIDPASTLLGNPKKVFRFLRNKGFEKSDTPACGQIVVYHTRTDIRQYGKIAEIDSEGQIMVISKFGLSHFCKHRIELTQFHYGNAVIFLKEPKKIT